MSSNPKGQIRFSISYFVFSMRFWFANITITPINNINNEIIRLINKNDPQMKENY